MTRWLLLRVARLEHQRRPAAPRRLWHCYATCQHPDRHGLVPGPGTRILTHRYGRCQHCTGEARGDREDEEPPPARGAPVPGGGTRT